MRYAAPSLALREATIPGERREVRITVAAECDELAVEHQTGW